MTTRRDDETMEAFVIRAIREEERERCIAEIRRVQRRNTATVEALDTGKPHTWNSAVETMAAECIDAING